MRRISSHEPRYKHSTQRRKIRHADSREQSQTSSSEEEDESTDSEESESSSENETLQEGSFPSVADLNKRGAVKKSSKAETFMHTRIDGPKILMLDKVTQKNLLSPFPSFTLPPIYKELVRPGFQRTPDIRRFLEADRKHSGKPPKPHAKRKETRIEDDESSGSIQKHSEGSHRRSRERGYHSKGRQSHRVLSCVSGCEMKDTSRRVLKPLPETGSPTKPVEAVLSPRKRKTVGRDSVENRDEQHKTMQSAGSCVNDSAVRGLQKHIKAEGKGECRERGGGEVKEKLVYVLEEEGKERRKVETDLFTLNEILTIKKDLLELSEFAKKLKRMKEIAREPVNGKNQQSYCHCKPASELLRDVNRRIEALEARQEELEKGSRPGCKGDVEIQSKKETEVKTFSECQSNTAEIPKQSALSTAPSFHRMEMILPRADGFSNNSDIVNELMDIKTQLQKLEKRRMSKELSESLECTDVMRQSKLEDRGIAVYSSKTYILTENLKTIEEVKPELKSEIKPEAEKEASKVTEGNLNSDRTKGDVENWLRNVSLNHMENVTVCELTKGPKSRGHLQKEGQHADLKRKDCLTTSKNENFENQEQPKNRATGKGGKEADSGIIDLTENITPGGRCSKHLQYKECIVTPSGKIFARITKSKTQPLKESPNESQARPQQPQSPMKAMKAKSPEVVRQTGSCSSIPSIPHAKEGRRKLKNQPKVMKSKSVHELSGGSSVCKFEKTARNTSLKNSDKAEQTKMRGKRHKEDKNEFVKRLQTQKRTLYHTTPGKPSRTSSSHSEFLASMNLEAAPNSLVMDSSGFLLNSEKKDIVLSYPATNEAQDHRERSPCCSLYLEGESARKRCREERKEMKKRESELKKILKKQIREYEQRKKKLKKEQRRREMELINEFKCQKYKCLQKCKSEYEAKKEALLCETRGKSSKPQYKVLDIEKEKPCEVKTEEVQCKRVDSVTPESTTPESAESQVWKRNDSLEIYKKTLKKGLNDNDEKKVINVCEDKRPVRPTCDRRHKRVSEQVDKRWLQNFMRNLDVVYPRFCALSSPSNCHHEKKKKKFTEPCSWLSLCGKHSSRFRTHDHNDESPETAESDYSENVNRKCEENRYYDYNQQQPKPEHYPCRCMRVYMQTQMQNGWSGLRPPRKSSTDTSTDLTRSRSAPTCDSNKSSYVASGPKSQICLAAHECKEEKSKKKKKKGSDKHERKDSKKRKHKSKTDCYDKCICKCRKCGNVHCKEDCTNCEGKSHAGSGKSKKSKKKLPSCSFSNRGRNGGDIFPMFSFLSHFCKTKPRDKKFSLKRITEIPQLKTCSTTRKKRSDHSSRKHHKRKHRSKDRMSNETPSTSECRKNKRKDKRKKRKSADRKCGCEEHSKRHKKKKRKSGSENERSNTDSQCSKKGKKHKKKHKKKFSDEESERNKKKKKKNKKKRKCTSNCNCMAAYPETLAYYQTIYPSKSKSAETVTSETNESSECSSSEDSGCCSEPKLPKLQTAPQKNRQIKDRLSSFHSFWKNFRKAKPSKPSPESNEKTEGLMKKIKRVAQVESTDTSFINDCSRSSEIPLSKQVVEMKAEPRSFAKIRKKRQKLSKEEKKLRKELKKESRKDALAPKSKSARRRHI